MLRILRPEIFLFILMLTAAAATGAAQDPVAAEINVSRCWTAGDVTEGRSFSLDFESLFVGTNKGEVASFSRNGGLLWSSSFGGKISSNLLITDSSVITATSVSPGPGAESADLLRSLSKATGVTNWIVKLPLSEKYFLAEHGGAIVVIASSGQMLAVDQKSGTSSWTRSRPPLNGDPLFVRGKALLLQSGQQIATVSLESGEIENTRKIPIDASVILETPGNQLVVGDQRGNVLLLNGGEKPVWKFKSGGAIVRLYSVVDYIVAVSNDNFAYHILLRNGDVDWKWRLASRVAGAGIVADRLVVTQSFDDSSLAFTDLSTGKIAGQIFLEPGERLTVDPIASGSSLFIVTDRGISRVSTGGC